MDINTCFFPFHCLRLGIYYQSQGIGDGDPKSPPRKKEMQEGKASCLRRPYKEAEKRRDMKGKRARYPTERRAPEE